MAKLDRLGWAAGLSFVSHGARIGIRVNEPAVLATMLARLPPGWKHAPTSRVDTLYSLIVGTSKHRGVRPFHLAYRGSARIARATDVDQVLHTLAADIEAQVALRSRDRLFVHAGVVGWRGRAIVIPGPTRSGKSSLVAALVRAGARYYSDEFAVLDQYGRVHAFARPLSLRDAVEHGDAKNHIAGISGRVGIRRLPVGLIVVTQFRRDAEWCPRRLSPGQAVLALFQNTLAARVRPQFALAVLERVVAIASTFQGARGEAQPLASWLLARVAA
jgi:hypothetical protein